MLSVSAVTEAEMLALWVICWLVEGAAGKRKRSVNTAKSMAMSTTVTTNTISVTTLLPLRFVKRMLKKINSCFGLEHAHVKLSLPMHGHHHRHKCNNKYQLSIYLKRSKNMQSFVSFLHC